MKRRLIAILVAISVAATGLMMSSPNIAYADNTTSATTALQNVGDEMYGFKVVKTQYDETTKSNQILLEHVKSGAKMLVVKNSDLNRGFAVGFNTPAESDKGINHILEHSLLGGSEKYPSNNIIFNVMNSTYTSFINAFTMQNSTVFPVCSQNEEQLMKLTDIYMDAVYHPLIAKDKKVFEREAWRYELEDENSPLTVNGVVYNEMRGNYGNMDSVESENDKKAIFPTTNQGYDSGGVPSSILDLSYEEFLNTYKKNYVPSNSFMVLYGDVNYGNFLKMINDNYLSSYEKTDVSIDRSEEKEFSELAVKDYDFPVSKDTDTTNKSKIDVVYAMPDMKKISEEDRGGLLLLASLLGDESLDFNKDLRNSGIAEDFDVSMDVQTYQPTITITASNADPARKMEFYNLVNDELKKIVQNGIDKETAQSAIASVKFADLQQNEQGASNAITSFCTMNTIFGDPTVNLYSYLEKIKDKLNDGYIENLIDKYLVKNTQKALVTTNPKAGLLEENNAKLQEEMEKKKASMSKEEIDDLIKETKDFKEWNGKQTDQSVIDSLKAVTSKDIPVEVKDYSINEDKNQGVNLVTADADIADFSSVQLAFDESALSKEELLYLDFYKDLLNNNTATSKYTENQISNLRSSKAYGFSSYMNAYKDDKEGNAAHPVFGMECYTSNEDLEDVLNLSKDTLLNTKLDSDVDDCVKKTINNRKQSYQYKFSQPSSLGQLRAFAYDNLYYRYLNYMSGLDYYNFLLDLEKQYNANPQDVMNKIKEVRDKAFSKNNLTVLFAGDNESQTKFKDSLGLLTNDLSDKTYEKAQYDLPIPDKREALTTNTEVQYVAFNSNLNNADIKSEGKYDVLAKILDEKVLIPELRLKGGAYGAGASINNNSYDVYTFRDNNFVNSLNVIENVQNYMQDICTNITENSLDNYIISTYAQENYPVGELSGAQQSLNLYMNKTSTSDIKETLKQIKDTTVDDIKKSPEILQKLNENANYVVVCSPEYAKQNKDMFDKIIPLQ